MLDKWFSLIELPLTFEQFDQLPRNSAYKYGYFAGTAWLSPRPKSYHALLDHAYIWVHYYCTERPDMQVIYGR